MTVALSGNTTLVGSPDADGLPPVFASSAGAAWFGHLVRPDGAGCLTNGACQSDFCVDGVCCESACGGGVDDCMGCSTSLTGGISGVCAPLSPPLASAHVCRPSAGVCDPEESRSPTDTACPSDALHGPELVCRPAVSECDLAEECSGAGVDCPPDGARPPGSVCGQAPTGVCDLPDGCEGTVGALAGCVDYFASAGAPGGDDGCCAAGSCIGPGFGGAGGAGGEAAGAAAAGGAGTGDATMDEADAGRGCRLVDAGANDKRPGPVLALALGLALASIGGRRRMRMPRLPSVSVAQSPSCRARRRRRAVARGSV